MMGSVSEMTSTSEILKMRCEVEGKTGLRVEWTGWGGKGGTQFKKQMNALDRGFWYG